MFGWISVSILKWYFLAISKFIGWSENFTLVSETSEKFELSQICRKRRISGKKNILLNILIEIGQTLFFFWTKNVQQGLNVWKRQKIDSWKKSIQLPAGYVIARSGNDTILEIVIVKLKKLYVQIGTTTRKYLPLLGCSSATHCAVEIFDEFQQKHKNILQCRVCQTLSLTYCQKS